MAVTVVGKDASKAKRCTCCKCGSILEYFSVDTFTETHSDYGGGSDTYKMIHCPTCSYKINLGS